LYCITFADKDVLHALRLHRKTKCKLDTLFGKFVLSIGQKVMILSCREDKKRPQIISLKMLPDLKDKKIQKKEEVI